MVSEDELMDAQYKAYRDQAFDRDTSNAYEYEKQERSMAKEQLDLSEELERIEHLLRGHVIEEDKATGEKRWAEPKDNDMVVLSEYGIHLILNTITWYVNKNTLLSNYDDETILHKMEDFAGDLADTIFIEYEKVFQYPSLDDCKKVFEKRIEYKVQLKQFSNEIAGIKVEEKEIKDEILKKLEDTIEKELEKIKMQIIKSKLKRFFIIMRCVQDAVHSTYLRAYKGMERKTLREHINITENMGGNREQQQQRAGFSPLSWFGKK